jgi:Leucine-rich repeat (LRR) protein
MEGCGMKYFITFFFSIFAMCFCACSEKHPASQAETAEAMPQEQASQKVGAEQDADQSRFTFIYDGTTYFDLNDLDYFLEDRSIQILRIAGGTFDSLSPLAELQNLDVLEISFLNLDDITPIAALTNLKKLDLHILGNNIPDITPVSSLVNLKELHLYIRGGDFRELLPLRQLEELEIATRSKTELDVTYIAQLESLKRLSLRSHIEGRDSQEIEELFDLELATYPDAGSIKNIQDLKKLANLEMLTLYYFGEIDISWIPHLQKLEQVYFRQMTIKDISPLAELPNLTYVNLYRSAVLDGFPALLDSQSIKEVLHFFFFFTLNLKLYDQFEERGIYFMPYFSDR